MPSIKFLNRLSRAAGPGIWYYGAAKELGLNQTYGLRELATVPLLLPYLTHPFPPLVSSMVAGLTLNPNRAATAAMFFINGLSFGSWAARVPSIKEAIGMTPSMLGWALICMGAGALLSIMSLGPVITKFGSRRITIGSCILTLLTFVSIGTAANYVMLLLLVFLFGITAGLMDLAMNTNAVVVEKKLNRSIMSSFHAAWSIGGMAGAAIGGFMIWHGSTILTNFACVAAGAAVLALALSAYLLDDKPDAEESGHHDASLAATTGPAAKQISLITLAVICCCAFLSEGAIADWSALFMLEVVRTEQGNAALGFAAFSMAMAVGRLTGDSFIARFTDAGALLTGGVLSTIGILLVVSFPVLYVSPFGFIFAGLGLSVQVPITFRLAGHSTERPPAESIASVARAGYFGLLAGPSIFGYLADWLGLRASLTVLIPIGVFTIVMALRIRRSLAQS